MFSWGQKARSATCALRPLWISKDKRLGSGSLPEIGRFQVNGSEGGTVKSFKYKEDNLFISVGIDFVYEYSRTPQRPYKINMSINLGSKEQENSLEKFDASEAEVRYQKKWNLLVKKSINFDDRIYQFLFHCWDNGK